MPMFPGNRPASVTNDPETAFTGPLKTVFPGARPASVTRLGQRDGDTGARKGHFPTGSSVATSSSSKRDSGQTNNASYGGQYTPGGSYKYPSQSPDHVQKNDAIRDAKPSAVTAITATAGAGQVSVAFTPGAVRGDTYTLKLSPGGKTNSEDGSPLVITGLTAGAYTGTIVATNDNGNGATANVASFTVT